MVPGQHVPKAVRQAQHPLTDGYTREDAIDEVGRALGHAPAPAARTHRPALARERHQVVQPTAGAVKPGEAAGEKPAPQKPAELFLDKPRQPVAIGHTGRLGPERLEVIAHHLVEHALRGRLRHVGGGRTTHASAVAKAAPLVSGQDLRGQPVDRGDDTRSSMRFLRTRPDWRIAESAQVPPGIERRAPGAVAARPACRGRGRIAEVPQQSRPEAAGGIGRRHQAAKRPVFQQAALPRVESQQGTGRLSAHITLASSSTKPSAPAACHASSVRFRTRKADTASNLAGRRVRGDNLFL